MELSSLFITPKRKTRSSNSSSSSVKTSPGEKRWKQSYSPATSNDGDEIMAALNLTEGVNEKLDLILVKLISLDSRMEELNLTVNGIQDKVSHLQTEIDVVQDEQKTLDGKFSHIVKNAEFVDE